MRQTGTNSGGYTSALGGCHHRQWQGKVVEPEGPHTEHRRNDADRADNVVRFPRDWFGPPDELVPIGRTARRPDPPTPLPAPTRTAADFWGEESATVHDALPPAPPKRVTRIAARVRAMRRVARERATHRAAHARAGILEFGRSARRVVATPAALVLALVLVTASVFVATRPGGSRSPRTASSTGAAVTTAARREGTILAASVLTAARHAARHPTPHVPAVHTHPAPARSRHTTPAAASPSPPAAQPAPVSQPATPASTESVGSSSGSAATGGTSATGAGAGQAGASEASPSQAGPTGPAAAFGPGY